MWGWKAVERLVEPSVSFGDGKRILQQGGFQLHVSAPAYAVFRSSGTQNPWRTLAPEGRDVPLELALAQSIPACISSFAMAPSRCSIQVIWTGSPTRLLAD